MPVPYWVEDAIFYQIFPDRFFNGDPGNDPANVRPWNAAPTITGFQGGDLRGIINKIDYLLDLGINAIYLNPIFLSTSTHRYNTTDYYKVDPKLGTMQDFRAFLEVAHRNDIRVILDGVFNHCGRSFFAFSDLLENQEQSPYKDWFHVRRFPVDAYSPGDAIDYLGWWNYKSLPKFNTGNPEVRRMLLNIARFWVEQGIDGWRLDVPNEIDDDTFWAEFRETVKSVNRDAYLLGEIWDADPRWLGNEHFDGLMHYPVRDAILAFVNGTVLPSNFAERLERPFTLYDRPNIFSMYVLLGSHDTERLWTICKGDLAKVQLATLIQFSYPGAPAVYYGDEVGLPGGKDPDCRHTFLWDTSLWNTSLRGWVGRLISLRKRLPVMRRGDFQRLLVDDQRGAYVYCRGLGQDKVVVALNASPVKRSFHVPVDRIGWPDGRIVHNLVGSGDYIVSGDRLALTLEPWSGQWIQ